NGSGAYTLTLTSVNNFSGSITLGANGYPPGTSGFSPSSPVFLGAGQTVTVTSTVTPSSSAPVGTSSVTFTADSGSIHQQSPVNLTVITNPTPPPTFTLSVSPSSLGVTHNSTGIFTLTLTSVNNFAGSVVL